VRVITNLLVASNIFPRYGYYRHCFGGDTQYGGSKTSNRRWAQEIIKANVLAERAELTSKRSTPKRRKEIAACDSILDRFVRLLGEEAGQ
jgi:hypothetical protein